MSSENLDTVAELSEANAASASLDSTSQPNESNAQESSQSKLGAQDSDTKPANKRSRSRRGGRGRGRRGGARKAWSIEDYQVEPSPGKTRFHDLPLRVELMRAIAEQGFSYATPIQAKSLPYTLAGHDVVGKAQTGTGKTAAFLITVIDDLLRNPVETERYAGEPRALIIAPTRELVMQIADDARGLTKHTDIKVHSVVGGMDYGKQQTLLHYEYVDILVATPGRLIDFCSNQDVYLDRVEFLVIDEADRMLDMGFIPQVRRIVRMTPRKENRQTLFFSATFTDDVNRLVDQWTNEPTTIEIEPETVAADSVEQKVFIVGAEEKQALLENLLRKEEVRSGIIFANRRDQTRNLYEKLKSMGFRAGMLSGEVPQQKRVRTLEAFKNGEITILVATDVAGRGIHIDGVSHVVNYTLPEEPEDYVHRIGRTGRAGMKGVSISFACEDDSFRLEPIEKLLGRKLECELAPENLLSE